MMTIITEPTAEQEARFPEFVEKWTRIGLCAEPANRPAAEEGVRLAYRLAGQPQPNKIVWCGSPLAMGINRHIARNETWVGASVLERVRNSAWDSVRGSIPASVWGSVRGSVEDSVSLPVSASVSVSVVLLVADLVSDLVAASVAVSLWEDSVSSQRDSHWLAYHDYLRVVCGLTEQTEKLLGLMQVAENGGWWMPREHVCWICERPNRIIRDDRGWLHCEDGPALSYSDGFTIYAIHGVRVDEQVVMSPRTQSVDKIRNELNAEIKRIRIERFGWGEYLREVGATVVDVRDHDIEATKEALMRTPDGQVVLVCACPSTSRVYSLEVPPTIATCGEAQDWLSGGLSSRVINGA